MTVLYVIWLVVGQRRLPGGGSVAYITEDVRICVGQVRAVSFAHAKLKARRDLVMLQGEARPIVASIVDGV